MAHTLSSSIEKPLEASENDVVVIKGSGPDTRTKPKGEFWGVAEPVGGHPMPRKSCIAMGSGWF